MKSLAVILALALTLASAGSVFAAKVSCVVDSVEGDKVTMTCKDADKVAPGENARVTTSKKGAVEGC